jgi:hypothetical protein
MIRSRHSRRSRWIGPIVANFFTGSSSLVRSEKRAISFIGNRDTHCVTAWADYSISPHARYLSPRFSRQRKRKFPTKDSSSDRTLIEPASGDSWRVRGKTALRSSYRSRLPNSKSSGSRERKAIETGSVFCRGSGSRVSELNSQLIFPSRRKFETTKLHRTKLRSVER